MANTAIDFNKTNEATIQDRCVVLSVEFRTYGTSRKLNMDKVETDADKNRLHATKHILESENMDAIHRAYSKTYNWLWTKCLPAPLRKGTYLLATPLIDEVDAKLRRTEADIKPFIEALKNELPELKEKDRRELRSQFNEDDYPTEQDLENSFYIYSQYIDFQVPDKLRSISNTLYTREVAKQAKAWEDAAEEAKEFLRETAMYLIDQFANQLKFDKKKRGRIYETTIDKLRQFVEDFSTRNIADDDKLLAITAKAKGVLAGLDAETLRDDDRLRKRILNEVESVKAEIAGLMNRPVRAIELE